MKQQLMAILGVAAALGISVLLPAIAQSGDNLIIPGQSIGQTHLGSDGDRYLSKLPKADGFDVGMSQTRQVWVAKEEGSQTNTLFIHTVSNGALNVQPIQGVTIDNIRVTSSWFHTTSGISTRSTLAQIHHQFPQALLLEGNPTMYIDAESGIAFEFSQDATAKSPCIAIMIYPSGNVHVTNAAEVSNILNQGKS